MRKVLLVSFFIFSFSFSKAQWVTIPDANFVSVLQQVYPSCMNGNQMDTTCSGIVNATTFSCAGQYISDLTGIQYFNSLQDLNCIGNGMTYIPSLPESLIYLDCKDNNLTGLPPLPNSLTYLDCWINHLTSLPQLPSSLTYLDCSDNSLTNLPALPQSLTELYCNENQLTSLPVLSDSLLILECESNQLIYLPSLPNILTLLRCGYNLISMMPSVPDSLNFLNCSGNLLTSLPFLPNALLNLSCSNNPLMSLTNLPDSLYGLYITNSPGLLCLPPLLNFTGSATEFKIINTGITCFPNHIQHTGYIEAIDTMPVCDVFNTNGCGLNWNISGSDYLDINSDCIYQNSETLIHDAKMKLYQNGNLVQQGYFGGNFSFNTDILTYTVELDTTDFPFYVFCPTGGDTSIDITAADSLVYNVDFSLQCKPGYDNGVWFSYHSGSSFFPGNTTAIHIFAGDIVHNMFNVSCSSGIVGEVKVVINGPANFNSPIVGALIPSVNGDTIIYSIPDFSLVNAFTDFAFYVTTDTVAQLGDIICFDFIVTPTSGDNNISNNTLTHCFGVSNSYDPNEKEVSPLNIFNPTGWLIYTIHFQNTGTASAHHIQILDTLDADLDASTFQLLSYSHVPMVQLFGSKVHFNFVNINLPDSTTDSEGSKGYVSYRVKPMTNLPLGTTVENTASIYFDFNTPVVTNTVSNVICNPIAPTNLSQTICAGDSYNFNGTNITSTGNYSVTLNAVNGCDSVINLNLTVETINTNIQQSSDTLSVTSNGTIQWFDCNTQEIISGATGNIFIPTTSGIYSAIITEGNCVDTTSCTQVFTMINGLTFDHSQFTVYPNPADENITVTLTQQCENCQIEISNTLGQILLSEMINDKSEMINLELFPAGVYFIALLSDKISLVKKLVKD